MPEVFALNMNPDWFQTKKIREDLYLTTEHHFFEGNRCNIWLIKGSTKDVIIDTGLGVCNLRDHLMDLNLIYLPDSDREVIVICTHIHFDHVGGARHFDTIYIHEGDLDALQLGRQTETLNYVKSFHFYQQPYQDFVSSSYKVPPIKAHSIKDGDKIDIGSGQYLEVIHLPGHSKGSIGLYYPTKQELFTGDVVYECSDGGKLIDWLPTANLPEYARSARRLIDWMSQETVSVVYPGHFEPISSERTLTLLREYLETRENVCCRGCMNCIQCVTWFYFLFGCFRCCPC